MFSKNTNSRNKLSLFKKLLIIVAVLVVGIAIFIAYFFTGFAYKIAQIRCGHDPIYHSTGFKEGSDYVMPNHPDYKLFADGPFNKYYCTEEQAQSDGLYKRLNDSEYEMLRKQKETESLLKNSPVNFSVYAPTYLPDGISKKQAKTESGDMVIQDLMRQNGAAYGHIRQGKIEGASYKQHWLCNDNRYPCEKIGKTSIGHNIYKTYYPGGNSTVWGILTDSTYIIVSMYGEQETTGLNDQVIPAVLDSLRRIN